MVLRVGQRKTKNPSLSVLFVKSYWHSFSHFCTFNDRNLLPFYVVAYCVAKQKKEIYHQLHGLGQIAYSTTF
jgi:hypothetical protein